MLVLIVDDDQEVRSVLIELVELLGHSVMSATNGKEGIELFEKNPNAFGVVFTDRRMSGMWGEEVVFKIKKISPQTRIVLMSGDDPEEVLRVAKAAGADKILHKPFKLEEFKQALSFNDE